MTLDDFAKEYWFPLCESKLRECTIAGYKSVYKNHIREQLGDLELEEFTPRMIDRWIEETADSKGDGVAYKAWVILRIIIKVAYKYEFIENDPSPRVLKCPSKPHSAQKTLTMDECVTLMRGFEGNELEAWLIIALTCGLRREEACALEWEDINLATGEVKITKGAQDINGKLVVNPPKTRNGYRSVWLSGKHLDKVRKLGAGKSGGITPYRPNKTGHMYKKHCLRSGLPYVPPKNLRTTFGTLAIENGWDVGRVAKWMGHYDPSVTMHNYVHVRPEQAREISSMWQEKETLLGRLKKAIGL